jgi:hypothetical protein
MIVKYIENSSQHMFRPNIAKFGRFIWTFSRLGIWILPWQCMADREMSAPLMPLLKSNIPKTDVLAILELKIVHLSFANPQPFTHSSTNLIRWPSMGMMGRSVCLLYRFFLWGADISRSAMHCHGRIHIPKRLKVQINLPNWLWIGKWQMNNFKL